MASETKDNVTTLEGIKAELIVVIYPRVINTDTLQEGYVESVTNLKTGKISWRFMIKGPISTETESKHKDYSGKAKYESRANALASQDYPLGVYVHKAGGVYGVLQFNVPMISTEISGVVTLYGTLYEHLSPHAHQQWWRPSSQFYEKDRFVAVSVDHRPQ